MMCLAFLAAALVHRSEMRRNGLDPEITWDLLVLALVGGILGAKIYYILLNFPLLTRDPASLIFSRAGLVWYGGFLGGAGLVVWRIKRLGLGVPAQADMTAPALALAYGIGRIGCFLVGDDWGRPTASWVGIRFPEGAPPTRVDIIEREFGLQVDPELVAQYGEIVPVHPTQLYEVGLSLLIFLFLWAVRVHPHAKGWLFMVWLSLAGLERFFVEFFRAKDDRFFGPITLAQAISIALIVVGFLGARKLRGPSSLPLATEEPPPGTGEA
jgi:phosphatidylglycerol:prolipoprotein diacylglycerol transferase